MENLLVLLDGSDVVGKSLGVVAQRLMQSGLSTGDIGDAADKVLGKLSQTFDVRIKLPLAGAKAGNLSGDRLSMALQRLPNLGLFGGQGRDFFRDVIRLFVKALDGGLESLLMIRKGFYPAAQLLVCASDPFLQPALFGDHLTGLLLEARKATLENLLVLLDGSDVVGKSLGVVAQRLMQSGLSTGDIGDAADKVLGKLSQTFDVRIKLPLAGAKAGNLSGDRLSMALQRLPNLGLFGGQGRDFFRDVIRLFVKALDGGLESLLMIRKGFYPAAQLLVCASDPFLQPALFGDHLTGLLLEARKATLENLLVLPDGSDVVGKSLGAVSQRAVECGLLINDMCEVAVKPVLGDGK